MQVLILDSDFARATFIKKGLKCENIGADIAQTEKEALLQFFLHQYQAVLIRMNWLKKDNFKIYDRIRDINHKIVVFSFGDRVGKEDKILAFHKGVKTIFERPFSFSDLSFKIKQPFLDSSSINNTVLRLGSLTLNLETRQASRGGKKHTLKNKEFGVLECLMSNKNRLVSRSTILENVWDRNANILTNTVDVHISLLRKKIDKGFKNRLIKTLPGAGYMISEEQGLNS